MYLCGLLLAIRFGRSSFTMLVTKDPHGRFAPCRIIRSTGPSKCHVDKHHEWLRNLVTRLRLVNQNTRLVSMAILLSQTISVFFLSVQTIENLKMMSRKCVDSFIRSRGEKNKRPVHFPSPRQPGQLSQQTDGRTDTHSPFCRVTNTPSQIIQDFSQHPNPTKQRT